MSAALLTKLIEAGTPADLVAEVAMELGRALAAAELLEQRRAKDRQRKRLPRKSAESGESAETRRPPKENIKPPAVSDETGGEPPDPIKDLFDVGVSILKASGHDERHARSIIGKWRKTHSDGEVLAALVDCRTRAITNPVEWMPRRLNGTGPPRQRDHADIVLEEYAQREAASQ